MSRRSAREIALKTLFALDFASNGDVENAFAAGQETDKEPLDVLNFAGDEEPALIDGQAQDKEMSPEEKAKEEEHQRELAFSHSLVTGTKEKQAEIDEELSKLSKDWKLDRMSTIDRNLLRMSVYEIRYGEEKTPASIVINEAVELAKIYGTDESAGFINGILGTLVRNNG